MNVTRFSILAGILAASATGALAQVSQQQSHGGYVAPSTFDMRHPNTDTFMNELNSKVLLDPKLRTDATSYGAAERVAACVANKAKDRAGALIGGPMTKDANYGSLVNALQGKYEDCVDPGAVGMSMTMINGALAEALVLRENVAVQDRAVPSDLNAAKAFYATSAGVNMDSLSRCLAVYSPGLANRILHTTAGSAEERQAINALYAQTPECGVAASPGDIPPSEQRGAIAAGLYQWLHHG